MVLGGAKAPAGPPVSATGRDPELLFTYKLVRDVSFVEK
jgi:hypothetical protein